MKNTVVAHCLGVALAFVAPTVEGQIADSWPLSARECDPDFGCEPLLSCGDEAEVEIRGLFRSGSRSTAILAVADSDYCYLAHEDGLSVRLEPSVLRIHGWQICRDPGTQRDHLLVAKGTSSNGAPVRLETWHVASDGGLERVGEEVPYSGGELWGGEFPEGMVSADGVCWPRVNSMVTDILDGARETFFFDVPAAIPADAVQSTVLALGALENNAYLYEAVDVDDGSRWTVVMVRITPECRHEAVVLVRDGRTGTWQSILYVPGGRLATKTAH